VPPGRAARPCATVLGPGDASFARSDECWLRRRLKLVQRCRCRAPCGLASFSHGACMPASRWQSLHACSVTSAMRAHLRLSSGAVRALQASRFLVFVCCCCCGCYGSRCFRRLASMTACPHGREQLDWCISVRRRQQVMAPRCMHMTRRGPEACMQCRVRPGRSKPRLCAAGLVRGLRLPQAQRGTVAEGDIFAALLGEGCCGSTVATTCFCRSCTGLHRYSLLSYSLLQEAVSKVVSRGAHSLVQLLY
jgi:hypothetical protein